MIDPPEGTKAWFKHQFENEQCNMYRNVVLFLVKEMVSIRCEARHHKDYYLSDKIRNILSFIGVRLNDTGKDATDYRIFLRDMIEAYHEGKLGKLSHLVMSRCENNPKESQPGTFYYQINET